MLWSDYCILQVIREGDDGAESGVTSEDLKECPYDKVCMDVFRVTK